MVLETALVGGKAALLLPVPCLRSGCFVAQPRRRQREPRHARWSARRDEQCSQRPAPAAQQSRGELATAAVLGMLLAPALPAMADGTDFSQGGFAKESYYVTLGLFLLSLPGRFCHQLSL